MAVELKGVPAPVPMPFVSAPTMTQTSAWIPTRAQLGDPITRTQICGYKTETELGAGYWIDDCDELPGGIRRCTRRFVQQKREVMIPVECKTTTLSMMDRINVTRDAAGRVTIQPNVTTYGTSNVEPTRADAAHYPIQSSSRPISRSGGVENELTCGWPEQVKHGQVIRKCQVRTGGTRCDRHQHAVMQDSSNPSTSSSAPRQGGDRKGGELTNAQLQQLPRITAEDMQRFMIPTPSGQFKEVSGQELQRLLDLQAADAGRGEFVWYEFSSAYAKAGGIDLLQGLAFTEVDIPVSEYPFRSNRGTLLAYRAELVEFLDVLQTRYPAPITVTTPQGQTVTFVITTKKADMFYDTLATLGGCAARALAMLEKIRDFWLRFDDDNKGNGLFEKLDGSNQVVTRFAAFRGQPFLHPVLAYYAFEPRSRSSFRPPYDLMRPYIDALDAENASFSAYGSANMAVPGGYRTVNSALSDEQKVVQRLGQLYSFLQQTRMSGGVPLGGQSFLPVEGYYSVGILREHVMAMLAAGQDRYGFLFNTKASVGDVYTNYTEGPIPATTSDAFFAYQQYLGSSYPYTDVALGPAAPVTSLGNYVKMVQFEDVATSDTNANIWREVTAWKRRRAEQAGMRPPPQIEIPMGIPANLSNLATQTLISSLPSGAAPQYSISVQQASQNMPFQVVNNPGSLTMSFPQEGVVRAPNYGTVAHGGETGPRYGGAIGDIPFRIPNPIDYVNKSSSTGKSKSKSHRSGGSGSKKGKHGKHHAKKEGKHDKKTHKSSKSKPRTGGGCPCED